jgi:hypothetical protein
MSENEENDPQPLLSEATVEQLFNEVYHRVDAVLLVVVKDVGSKTEERTYWYGGSPHVIIGAARVVAAEIEDDLVSPNEGEDEETFT